MQNLWQSCLKQLEKELPAQQFSTWIRPLVSSEEALGELRLVAPNRFVLQWVKDRFLGRIEAMLAEQSGQLDARRARVARGQRSAGRRRAAGAPARGVRSLLRRARSPSASPPSARR